MIDGFTIALLALEFGQVWTKLGLRKSHRTLGEIVGLHNCAVAEVKSKSKMYGETNLMITYDVTCQKLTRLALGNSLRQHISPRKVNYGFSKDF